MNDQTGNKNVVLIMGKPNSGKSSSLYNMKNQKEWAYLNSDLKELPFKGNFAAEVPLPNPVDVITYIKHIEETPGINGGILDTLTFLMATYERLYVNTAVNTQQAWGEYANFYKSLIHSIKSGSKNYAILAHEDTIFNEQSSLFETKVPIKGSVGKTGVEADFTTVLSAKQISVDVLKQHPNDLLHITPDEEEDGVKRVFVTRITKEYAGEKMRSPIGLWNRNELYIDNDIEMVFNRLNQYYK